MIMKARTSSGYWALGLLSNLPGDKGFFEEIEKRLVRIEGRGDEATRANDFSFTCFYPNRASTLDQDAFWFGH